MTKKDIETESRKKEEILRSSTKKTLFFRPQNSRETSHWLTVSVIKLIDKKRLLKYIKKNSSVWEEVKMNVHNKRHSTLRIKFMWGRHRYSLYSLLYSVNDHRWESYLIFIWKNLSISFDTLEFIYCRRSQPTHVLVAL